MAKENFFEEHPILKHLLLMLAVSVVVVILIFLLLRLYGRHGDVCEMPDVMGLNIDEARDDNPNGLCYVVIDSVYQAGDPGGTILMQDPKAGTQIKPGRKVYVTISSYSKEAPTMPHLSNTASIAISTLEKEGLLGNLYFRVDESVAGAVLNRTYKGYEVQEGERLDPGALIDLTIAMRADNTAKVPFVIGKNSIDARREIHRNMLNIGREHLHGITERNRAIVVRTDPEYNGINQYPYGTEIEIWYESADKVDGAKLAREFKVDSSKIVRPEPDMNDESSPEGRSMHAGDDGGYSDIEW